MPNFKDIFLEGLEGVLSSLINQALGAYDKFLCNIVQVALHADRYMKSSIGMNFDKFYAVIYSYAICLIVLKYLKKGFSTYILWTDGDPDLDPVTMCIGFIKALIIAISYSTIYNTCADITNDMINESLSSLNTANISLDTANVIKLAVAGLLNRGLLWVMIALVYMILFIVLWIQFIKRGMELFILKAGIPLACVGLIDTDQGVFKVFSKKIIQELLTVLVQIVMLKLSLVLMINSHYMFGIAVIHFAIKTPQFLSEFIMMSSGGSALTKVSQTSMLIRNISK
ncbi:conjugal transfer protein TrbL family protein [[Clostridium] polysaccharolyticum]|uniref:Uncharacterized protein n=1 Tax=[Clostridium] polysaccharolyticum TaxID=29364 RepID=A0A1H9Y8M8_9FIRM|nr:conjugal transfer protein TrbL family protein [[Clostridium] polysaccharolyticum]SES65142.1 hypothetical protein SAMN04487772_101212 [[Clostridium] polysaccharolyticum]